MLFIQQNYKIQKIWYQSNLIDMVDKKATEFYKNKKFAFNKHLIFYNVQNTMQNMNDDVLCKYKTNKQTNTFKKEA